MALIPGDSRSRIVVTLGPASANAESIRALIDAGADVFRLNFSHGTIEGHLATLAMVRNAARDAATEVAVLQDLGGPKIRLGSLPAPLDVHPGDTLTLSTDPQSIGPAHLPVTYPRLTEEVLAGDAILLADGAVEIEVACVRPPHIECRVIVGGELSSGKGINVPGRDLSVRALTAKDRCDLEAGVGAGVDFIALSFVRDPDDIAEARKLIEAAGAAIPVVAKIERRECLRNLDAVIDASDAVMVARGDLGVEVPVEDVPTLQKRILRLALARGRPSITATQMLRSMVEAPRPTRAEAADVANAVLDGSDALMLSEETAVGRFPVDAVRMMRRIAREAENHLPLVARPEAAPWSPADALAESAAAVARQVGAHAIVTPTLSGATARNVARCRPPVPILALCSDPVVMRRLAMVWGVDTRPIPPLRGVDGILDEARRSLLDSFGPDHRAVVIAGLPLGEPGRTNFIHILDV